MSLHPLHVRVLFMTIQNSIRAPPVRYSSRLHFLKHHKFTYEMMSWGSTFLNGHRKNHWHGARWHENSAQDSLTRGSLGWGSLARGSWVHWHEAWHDAHKYRSLTGTKFTTSLARGSQPHWNDALTNGTTLARCWLTGWLEANSLARGSCTGNKSRYQ